MIERRLKVFLAAAGIVLGTIAPAAPGPATAQQRPEGCERKVFSVGSYDYLTEFARQSGEIGPDDRRYHLDLYEPEKHTTLEFRDQVPRYEEMREMALNLLR